MQYLNPVMLFNINISSLTNKYFAFRINSYNLIKQLSIHPIFFK